MEIVFLGTNGWYQTETGASTCTLVKTANENIILDAGSGFYRVENFLNYSKPVYIFLSHLHIDHIEGLQILNKFDIPSGIKIMVGPGMKAELESFLRPPFFPGVYNLKTKVEILEPPYDLPFIVETAPLVHASPVTAFRFSLENKTLVYALDTGYCDELVKISKNADLLITEASYLPGQKIDNNHMRPQEAAQAAAQAGVKKLAMIHFLAFLYKTFDERAAAKAVALTIFPNAITPRDLDVIVL